MMKNRILELAFCIIYGEPFPDDATDLEKFEAIQLAIRINCPDCGSWI